MKVKKLFVILIAITFILSTVVAGIFVFDIKKIDITFDVSENFKTNDICKTLNRFDGKNLLVFNLDEVYESMRAYPNIKVESVEKTLPNIIKIKIAERVTLFYLNHDGKTYCIDKEGIITDCIDGQAEIRRDIISINMDGISVRQKSLGNKIETSNDKLFYSVMDMVKSVNLTDCIKSVTLKQDITCEMRDAIFETYSGVKIVIFKADEDGVEKIKKAFSSYDSVTIDFVKSYSEIEVYKQDDGEIKVVWKS